MDKEIERENNHVYGIKKLKSKELMDHLGSNGILQEINRSFLHPLSMEMRINSKLGEEIEIHTTDNPKGFLLDRINKFQSRIFSRFSIQKHTERNRLLGFAIQTEDLYRTNNMEPELGLLIPPERKKIEAIIKFFHIFCHAVHSRLLKNHAHKDHIFDPIQFDKEHQKKMLLKNIEEEDWLDVAAIASFLHQNTSLIEEMKIITKYKIEFEKNQAKYEATKDVTNAVNPPQERKK